MAQHQDPIYLMNVYLLTLYSLINKILIGLQMVKQH